MTEKLEFFPNVFYDLIVFVSSTVTFGAGWAIGLGWLNTHRLSEAKAFDVILIIGAVLILGYEYGRVAETWSAVLVQSPLRFIGKHSPFLKSKDFCVEHPSVEHDLKLECLPGARPGGKWAVYFYAQLVDSRLGSDLLKRYAWEKLSRNSGFTFCCLFLMSTACLGLRFAGMSLPFQGSWRFGSVRFTVISAVMMVLTYYEYYKRNCWNCDLIKRVLPVLHRAEELHFWQNIRIVYDGAPLTAPAEAARASGKGDILDMSVAANSQVETANASHELRGSPRAGKPLLGLVLVGLGLLLSWKRK